MNKIRKMIGSMTAKFAALLVAFACAGNVWGAETTTIKNAAGEDITVYVVADGFYQSAATYTAANDFYITSKAGLEYFRDLVNGKKSVTDDYMEKGFYSAAGFHGAFYSNNLFQSKTVHLCSDIDLENTPWEPIGYVHLYSSDNGTYYVKTQETAVESTAKTYFYGSFDGHNHVISNVNIVRMLNNQSRPAQYWKNYGSYGLFGYVSANNPVFRNITIHNFTAICGENTLSSSQYAGDYLGVVVGDAGSNIVTFDNCHVTGTIDASSTYVAGGIVGIGNVNVTGCSVKATAGNGIVASTFAGGLVGAERCSATSSLNITGNTVSGVEVTSYRAGSLVGAMALDAKGSCSVTGNDVVDCIVNGDAATVETLLGPTTATTVMTVENNTVRTTLIVETGDLTPEEEITPTTTEVNYTVPVTVKDRSGNVVSETTAQEIAVSVADADIANTTLASVKIGDVVAKAIESVGEDATSVTAIEIQVKSTPGEAAQSVTYEVHPEAVVTVSKTGEAATSSTVELSNSDLAANATFTFDLDVSSLNLSEGDQVKVTHSWAAYTDAAGASVAAGSETTLATVSNNKVSITTTHFSTWTLEGITIYSGTVAVVFAADGTPTQYTTLAAATEAAYDLSGDVTVQLIANAAESATICQKAGQNLTVNGGGNTLTGQLIVLGMSSASDATRTETLTIKNFNFTGADSESAFGNGFVFFPNGATAPTYKPSGYTGSDLVHAHNVTIADCSFSATGNSDPATAKAVAIKSLSTGLDSIKLENIDASYVHSIQLFSVQEAELDGVTLANTKNGINFNFETAGVATIRNSSICPVEAKAYGIRIQGASTGVINLLGGTVISAANTFELGNDSPNVQTSDGTINVFAGSYKGKYTHVKGDYDIVVTGGIFEQDPSDYVAEGCKATALAQSSAEYAAGYRYTIGECTYVAQVVTNNGATTNKYEDLHAALEAGKAAGSVVTLLADVDLAGVAWEPVGTQSEPFRGTFDGNSKTISNLYIPYTYPNVVQNVGLIGTMSDATIKDLEIHNANVTGSGYVGALVGNGYTGSISGVTVSGNIKVLGYQYVGGLVGHGYARIEDCAVCGDGAATSFVRKAASSEINGSGTNGWVGGLKGFLPEGCIIDGCTVADISVLSNDDTVGGVTGMLHYGSTISDCTVSDVVVRADDDDDGYNGIIAGARYKGQPSSILDCTIENVTATAGNDTLTTLIGSATVATSTSGYGSPVAISSSTDGKVSYVYYDTLNSVVAAADADDVIVVLVSPSGLVAPEGWDFKTENNVTTLVRAVAQVGDQKFETLAAAVAAVPTDGTETTITMIADEELGNAYVEISAGKNIILDLNGKTVTSTYSGDGAIYNKGTLTVMGNGTINGNVAAVENEGTLTVENGTFTGTYVIYASSGSVTVNGGTLTGGDVAISIGQFPDSQAKYQSNQASSLTVAGGVIQCAGTSGYAIVTQVPTTLGAEGTSDAELSISGGIGAVTAMYGCAPVSIYSGSYSATSDSIANYTAVVTASGGATVAIYGGTFTSSAAAKNYAACSGNASPVTISGGTFNGNIRAEGTASSLHGHVAISGTAVVNGDLVNLSDVNNSTYSDAFFDVSGGSFASVVPEAYCAAGYSPVTTPDANDMYTVVSDYEAQIVRGGVVVQKGTLADMIAAATSGDTIQLLKDIVVTAQIVIPTSLTLDGNGYTIATTADWAVNVNNIDDGEVTIKNLTITAGSGTQRFVNVQESANLKLNLAGCTMTGCTYYAVNVRGSNSNIALNITDCNISGWCALNIWGAGGTVNVSGGTLGGVNSYSYAPGPQGNDFGVIVLNASTAPYEVTIAGTTLSAASVADSQNRKNREDIVLFNSEAANYTVRLDGCKIERSDDPSLQGLFKEEDGTSDNLLYANNTVDKTTSTTAVLPAGYAYMPADENGWMLVVEAVASVTTGGTGAGTTYYATFAAAIDAAEAYYAANDSYPEIVVLNETAEQSNPDWKIANGQLVKKEYVAQIVTNAGATTNKYETIAAAIYAAEDGDTIQILPGTHADVELTHVNGRFDNDGTRHDTAQYPSGTFAPNVTIVGGDGVTMAGIYFNGRIIPDNWTFKNIAFDGNSNTDTGIRYNNGARVSGLTVDSCTFVNGARLSLALKKAEGKVATDTVVTNCVFDGVIATGSGGATAIYLPDADGFTIVDCTVRNGGYNAIQAAQVASDRPVTITGNTFSGINSRIINMANMSADYTGTVTIEGNTFNLPSTPKSDCNYIRSGRDIPVGANDFGLIPAEGKDFSYYFTTTVRLTDGKFTQNPQYPVDYVADGYAAAALSTESDDYAAGYRYAIGKIAATDLVPAAGATDKNATYTFDVVVTNETGEIGTLATDQTVTVRVDDEHSIADVTLNDFDISDVLASAVSAVGTGDENVTVDLRVSSADVSSGKVTFEAHPEAVIQVGTATPEVVTLTNDDLADGATFSLKFYTGESFAVGALVKITHKSADYEDEVFIASVADDTAGRYVPVTVSHFSTFEIEPFTPDAGMVAVNSNTGVQYATLAEAVAAVPTDGTATTITMLDDVTIEGNAGLTIATGKNIVLDLNGKTVKQSVPNKAASAFIVNNGTLTIQDTSANHDGVLIAEGSNVGSESYSYGNYTIDNNGTLNIVSGTVESKMGNNAWYCACYAVNNAGALAISGGLVKGDGSAVRLWCDSTADATSLTMTGGEINGFWGVYVQNPSGSAGNNKGALSVTGGTITATRDCLFVDSMTDWTSGLDAEFSDGTFNAGRSAIRLGEKYALSGISISGGTYTTGTGSGYADVAPVSAADASNSALGIVSGGIFSKQPAADYVADGYAVVANTDAETRAAYPWTVGKVVAQIERNGEVTKYTSAQEALDLVQSGDTLTLYAGDHGTLYIRQSKTNSLVVDVTPQAGEYGPNDLYRALANVTIKGQEGARVNQIIFEAGYYAAGESSWGADWDRIIDSLMEIDNLKIEGVTFDLDKNTAAINLGDRIRVTGLTVENCTVNGTGNYGDSERLLYNTLASKEYKSENRELVYDKIQKYDVNFTSGLKNLIITGCTFNNLHQVAELRNLENLTFSGNTVNGNKNQTLLLTTNTGDSVSVSGTVTIANNSIDGTTDDRVFRLSSVNAEVSITGNTITGYAHNEADLIKISGSGDDAEYTIAGNNWSGTTSGLHVISDKDTTSESDLVAKIGTKYFTSLAAAIAAANDGDTVQLLADISVGAQTGNTSAFKVAGKSITIDGNGKTITATGDGKGYVFWFCEDANKKLANCSLKNLTINSTGYQIDILVGGNDNYLNTLSVDNVSITTQGEALYASDISEITATGSSFTQNGKYKSGKEEPYYAAVTVGYAGVITLTDCTVSAVDGSYAVAPFPSGGTINLNTTTVTGDLFAWVGNGATTTPADTVINVNSGKIAGNYGYKVSNNGNGHVAVINVNGGVFKNSPANVEGVVIKTGYAVVANTDAETKDAYPYTVGTPVAQNITTGVKYATLAEAVAEANAGDTVELLADIDLGTEGLVIADDKDFTLDIGEFNITGAVNGKLITNNGTLVVDGTTGCVYNTDVSAQSHDAILNNGTITINGGWFGDSDNDKTNANPYNRGTALRNYGTAVVNGGHFTVVDNNWPITAYAYVINTYSGTLTVNNADVYGKGNGSFGLIGGTATIVTGTFSVDGEYSHYALYNSGCNATVLGGTFTKVESSASQNLIYASGNGTTAISGGTFAAPKTDFIYVAGDTASVSISGGYFSAPVLEEYCASGYIPTTTTAEQYAATPYTVINTQIVYPTGDTGDGQATVGVPVPYSWITNNTTLLPKDRVPTADEFAAVTKAALEAPGANGVPLWQSYVLGFDPSEPSSNLRMVGVPVDGEPGKVMVKGLNIDIPEDLAAGTIIGYHLEESVPGSNVWTPRAETVEVDPTTKLPQVKLSLDAEVSGKILRLVVDIKTVVK